MSEEIKTPKPKKAKKPRAEKIAIPIPALSTLRILGKNIRDARLRRRIPMALLAERAGINVLTLGNIEKGSPKTSIGSYSSVLFSLGMVKQLENIANISNDTIGQMLEEERLPKRIRPSKKDINGEK